MRIIRAFSDFKAFLYISMAALASEDVTVVTHRLGSGTGSGCKYRELVSEVRQGAVLNLFLPRMRRTVDFLWREG